METKAIDLLVSKLENYNVPKTLAYTVMYFLKDDEKGMIENLSELLKSETFKIPAEIANFIVDIAFSKRGSEEDFKQNFIKHISSISTAAILR